MLKRAPRPDSPGEAMFDLHLRAHKLDGWQREYRFDGTRRWRFDYAHPATKVAVEIEGGVWTSGRHSRGEGYTADCEKYSTAAVQGWRIIRATTQQVISGLAIEWAKQCVQGAQG